MVDGIPLHHSHMKNHPLTPMWDSRIDKLMEPQSRYSCRCMGRGNWDDFAAGLTRKPGQIVRGTLLYHPGLQEPGGRGKNRIHVRSSPPSYRGQRPLEPLARQWTEKLSFQGRIPDNATAGMALLLAGSCSKATLLQIAWYQGQGGPCYQLNPKEMLEGRQTLDDAWRFVEEHALSIIDVQLRTSEHRSMYSYVLYIIDVH